MQEVWKALAPFPKYEVSNFGKVRVTETRKLLKGSISRGYIRYDLCVNGKRIVRLGHRLVAETFLPVIDGKDFVNHIDGNKANNVLTNLEWCTPSENMQHASKVLGMSSVNKRAVKCIESGKVFSSAYEAEKVLGIPNSCINRCCNGVRKSTNGLHFEFA